jgi:uncharacterized LabA/DUF88 family protein
MDRKKAAVIIDGSYLRIEFKNKHKKNIEPQQVVEIAKRVVDKDELFRIYFYDAEPYPGKLTNPITNVVKDFSNDYVHNIITQFQRSLARMDYVAFRSGTLAFRGWALKDSQAARKKSEELTGDDVKPILTQKTIDVKIGLDIAWIASRKIVDKIIIITGDSDFIPAMKFARKEGLHIILCSLAKVRPEMKEHADEYKLLKL